jgi:hypothetical protein
VGATAELFLPSFQQVQTKKYERGANRIGASRLQQMSHILQVPWCSLSVSRPRNSSYLSQTR